MASSTKEIIYLAIVPVVGIIAYKAYKLLKSGGQAVAAGYNKAVDTTADVIADITGLSDKEEELAQPQSRDSEGFQALLKVVEAYKSGGQVTQDIWQAAYNEYPEYGTVLRAGKKWGYGYFWQYIGKDF